MEGPDVKEFQRTLTTRFEAWDIDKRIEDDGDYGMETRFAAQQVCEGLGILQDQAMRRGVTPELRSTIRDPTRRTLQELARAERRKDYRAKLRERYKGGGPKAALTYAERFVGHTETAPNRSPQIDKWIRAAGHDPRTDIAPGGGVPWCGCFVNACLMAAGLPNGKPFNIAAVENIVQRARGEIAHWELVTVTQGRPGDLACWKDKPPKTGWAHVEIVETRNSATSYVCIGGNTGPSTDRVIRATRTTEAAGGRITVFARPPYDR
jgi:CHAP domain-containing protein